MLILDFLLGLAIFLYGMHELERGITKLSDARLRYWLRSSTGTSLGSVGTGVFTTALMQSSSMVSLMVMAFAAAGILPLVNSIGIILGANLGTTFTGWIVATLGFKLNLETVALPLFGLSAGALVLLQRVRVLRFTALAIVGLGLLLLGLGLMKESMEGLPEAWNVSRLQDQPAVVYLLLGVALAALIQSSSAVMMMALAALDAGILSLPGAAALVIGADLGTTSTTILGSLIGGVIKRQLAMAHFLFNVIVDGLAFVALLPLLPLFVAWAGVSDPLYSLVGFHSLMNVLGLLAFIPFIERFATFIEKRVGERADESAGILDTVPAEVSDAAIVALQRSVHQLVFEAAMTSARVMSIDVGNTEPARGAASRPGGDFRENYESLKQAEGDILRYALKAQAQPLAAPQALNIDRLVRVTRSAVYSVKTLKDIRHNLDELRYGEPGTTQDLYQRQRSYMETVTRELITLLAAEHPALYTAEKLEELQRRNDTNYDEMNSVVHQHADHRIRDDQMLSTELNVNREIHHSCKAMVKAVEELSLGPLSAPEAHRAAHVV